MELHLNYKKCNVRPLLTSIFCYGTEQKPERESFALENADGERGRGKSGKKGGKYDKESTHSEFINHSKEPCFSETFLNRFF